MAALWGSVLLTFLVLFVLAEIRLVQLFGGWLGVF
jgi:hypothetical protein